MDDKTKEVIEAAGILAAKIIERAKDGIGIDDAVALLADTSVRAAAVELIDGVKGLPTEVKTLGISDLVDLTPVAVKAITGIIAAAKA